MEQPPSPSSSLKRFTIRPNPLANIKFKKGDLNKDKKTILIESDDDNMSLYKLKKIAESNASRQSDTRPNRSTVIDMDYNETSGSKPAKTYQENSQKKDVIKVRKTGPKVNSKETQVSSHKKLNQTLSLSRPRSTMTPERSRGVSNSRTDNDTAQTTILKENSVQEEKLPANLLKQEELVDSKPSKKIVSKPTPQFNPPPQQELQNNIKGESEPSSELNMSLFNSSEEEKTNFTEVKRNIKLTQPQRQRSKTPEKKTPRRQSKEKPANPASSSQNNLLKALSKSKKRLSPPPQKRKQPEIATKSAKPRRKKSVDYVTKESYEKKDLSRDVGSKAFVKAGLHSKRASRDKNTPITREPTRPNSCSNTRSDEPVEIRQTSNSLSRNQEDSLSKTLYKTQKAKSTKVSPAPRDFLKERHCETPQRESPSLSYFERCSLKSLPADRFKQSHFRHFKEALTFEPELMKRGRRTTSKTQELQIEKDKLELGCHRDDFLSQEDYNAVKAFKKAKQSQAQTERRQVQEFRISKELLLCSILYPLTPDSSTFDCYCGSSGCYHHYSLNETALLVHLLENCRKREVDASINPAREYEEVVSKTDGPPIKALNSLRIQQLHNKGVKFFSCNLCRKFVCFTEERFNRHQRICSRENRGSSLKRELFPKGS